MLLWDSAVFSFLTVILSIAMPNGISPAGVLFNTRSQVLPQWGGECRHNLAYWRQENVLALGPAAWGYLEGLRYANPGRLDAYIESAKRSFSDVRAGEILAPRDRAVEAAILALRTRWGIDKAAFAKRWGASLRREVEAALSAIPPRLLRDDGRSLALTGAGMRVGNAIWSDLLKYWEVGG